MGKFRGPGAGTRTPGAAGPWSRGAPVRCRGPVSILLLGIAWVFGCAVGPDYERPAIETPGVYHSPLAPPELEPAEAASLADLPWWDVYREPAIAALIALAIEQNYDLRLAAARVEAALQQQYAVRSAFFPQIDYEGAGRRARLPLTDLVGDRNYVNRFKGMFDAAWELDVWGRIRRADEAARAQLLGTEEFRRGVLLSLVSEVASAYFNLLTVDRQLVIARETKQAFEKTLELFERKYQRGAGSKLDVERARANVADAAATIPLLESQRVAVENQLSILIGQNPEAIPRGAGLEAQRLPVAPPGLPSELLERRPDVLQAEQAVVAANAAVGVATANFFPRIGLTAFWGGSSDELRDIVDQGARAWSFGAGLTGPIFQGGLLLAQYREQQAIWEEATARYEKTVIEAFADVSNALTAQKSLAEQRVQRALQVEALEASVRLSLSRYEQGLASYFEVVDSQQRLFPAQLNLAETRRDELDASVQLYRALGGGWKLGPNWVRPSPAPAPTP